MPSLLDQLVLERCPHCNVDKPSFNLATSFLTNSFDGRNKRYWKVYSCQRCGGAVTAYAQEADGWIVKYYPSDVIVDEAIPEPAKAYLSQAIDSLHAPAGSIMLSASAVDAMFKAKGYKEGKLYPRINKAAENHLITEDMAKWAHEVRLDANVQRHADEGEPMPTEEDARLSVDFAKALAEFLFVLPSKVRRGLKDVGEDNTNTPSDDE